jgi:hypothetical protein
MPKPGRGAMMTLLEVGPHPLPVILYLENCPPPPTPKQGPINIIQKSRADVVFNSFFEDSQRGRLATFFNSSSPRKFQV